MPVMDEFAEERSTIKNASFKDKCKYVWDYYKWHIFAVILVIAVIIGAVNTIVNRKETAFYAAFINMADADKADAYREGFYEFAGIDPEKNVIYFDTEMRLDLEAMDNASMSTSEKMLVYVAAGDIDVMVSDLTGTNRYAYNQILVDLRTVFSEEELKKYEHRLYYMDADLIHPEERNQIISYPDDPSDPTTMSNPIPVGIDVGKCKGLSESFYYGGPHYFCILANSKRPELAMTFFRYVESR